MKKKRFKKEVLQRIFKRVISTKPRVEAIEAIDAILF